MSFAGEGLLGNVIDFGKDLVGGITGSTAAKASRNAAQTQAAAQMEALNYLKQREKIPQQFREGALGMLGGLYGLEGGTLMANKMIQQNPIFQATLGMLPQQEEAILRNQSATGALRTGASDAMLAENQRQNRLQAYQNVLGGLQGLANLPSNANQIAATQAGIGQTLAQGQIGAAQAQQQGISNTLGLGMNALALAGFSDIRLKDNIQPAGKRYGHDWFTWEWNDKAAKYGLSGEDEGVIADLVKENRPDLVGEIDGYLTVNYAELANG